MKKLSQRQYDAVGRITGCFPESFHPEALTAFFAYTDRGETVFVGDTWRMDYERLMEAHQYREYFDDLLIKEFWDWGGFIITEYLSGPPLPLAFLIRVFDCCRKGFGFIPLFYYAPEKDWESVKNEKGRYAPCYLL